MKTFHFIFIRSLFLHLDFFTVEWLVYQPIVPWQFNNISKHEQIMGKNVNRVVPGKTRSVWPRQSINMKPIVTRSGTVTVTTGDRVVSLYGTRLVLEDRKVKWGRP